MFPQRIPPTAGTSAVPPPGRGQQAVPVPLPGRGPQAPASSSQLLRVQETRERELAPRPPVPAPAPGRGSPPVAARLTPVPPAAGRVHGLFQGRRAALPLPPLPPQPALQPLVEDGFEPVGRGDGSRRTLDAPRPPAPRRVLFDEQEPVGKDGQRRSVT